VTDTAAGTADTLQASGSLIIADASAVSGDILYIRFFRDADAGGDTYGDDANFSNLDILYTADKLQ